MGSTGLNSHLSHSAFRSAMIRFRSSSEIRTEWWLQALLFERGQVERISMVLLKIHSMII
jgi:hypothetical protein